MLNVFDWLKRTGVIHFGIGLHWLHCIFLILGSQPPNNIQMLRRLHVLTVTVASRPSGTLATMIPMRKMTASSQEYPKMIDRTKKDSPRKTATPVMMWIKCSISLAMGVFPVSSPEVSVAMRPITVRSPVQTTIPRAVPNSETEKVTLLNLTLM